MTITTAKKIIECYDEESGKIAIIKTMVNNKEISEAEAGFLIIDLVEKRELNVL